MKSFVFVLLVALSSALMAQECDDSLSVIYSVQVYETRTTVFFVPKDEVGVPVFTDSLFEAANTWAQSKGKLCFNEGHRINQKKILSVTVRLNPPDSVCFFRIKYSTNATNKLAEHIRHRFFDWWPLDPKSITEQFPPLKISFYLVEEQPTLKVVKFDGVVKELHRIKTILTRQEQAWAIEWYSTPLDAAIVTTNRWLWIAQIRREGWTLKVYIHPAYEQVGRLLERELREASFKNRHVPQ